MKRFALAILMLLVGSSFSVAVPQESKAMGDKAGLEKTVNAFFDVLKAGNTDQLKPYYTDDYTFTGPDGKMMTLEDRLKTLKEGTAPIVVDSTERMVRTYGSTGVVTGIATTKDASGTTEKSRFTQVWTWQGGRWKLAASHVSKIA